MKEGTEQTGYCIAFGGSNARVASCNQGEIYGFESVATPERAEDFFVWMARQVLNAADDGNTWVVSGFPGPVSMDGRNIGPMMNIPGLSTAQYDLGLQLTLADTAVGRLLEEGMRLVAVNDGELAAQAAAAYQTDSTAHKIAALIMGTGVGAGVVTRDAVETDVFRTDHSNPTELGHIAQSNDPIDTYENAYSGPAIEQRYWESAKDMSSDHVAWQDIGRAVGRMSLTLGLMQGVDVVVPTGGVGAGASDKYYPHTAAYVDTIARRGNGVQQQFMPEIVTIPPSECQVFEMYGAPGVARDFLTR